MKRDPLWAKLSRTWTKIRLLKNWHEVVLPETYFPYKPQMTARLRNGLVFEIKNTAFDMPILYQIFSKDIYGDFSQFRNKKTFRILDIGGHIGMFALYATYMVPTAEVFLYEPDPNNLKTLKQNITKNGYVKQIHVLPNAVSSKKEMRSMFVNPTNTSMNNFYEKNEARGTNASIDVSCITLEDIVRETNTTVFDFAKIDCEGSEYEILFSAPDHVFRALPHMVIEWHRHSGHEPQELVSFLQTKGYQVQFSKRPRIITATREH